MMKTTESQCTNITKAQNNLKFYPFSEFCPPRKHIPPHIKHTPSPTLTTYKFQFIAALAAPTMLNAEGKMKVSPTATDWNHFRRKYLNSACIILHSAFRASAQ
jgi:hypothetical protein